MRNIMVLFITSLATFIIFGALIYYSFINIEPKEVSWEAAQGKKVWDDYGCIQCHAILGNGGYAASDLTNILITKGEDWLRNFFINPPLMPASNNTYHKKIEEEFIGNLLEYLRLVDEINTLNWPPLEDEKSNWEIKRIDSND